MNAEDSIDEELLRAISNPSRLRSTKKADTSDEEDYTEAPVQPGVIDVTDLLFSAAVEDEEEIHLPPEDELIALRISPPTAASPVASVHSVQNSVHNSVRHSVHNSDHNSERSYDRRRAERRHNKTFDKLSDDASEFRHGQSAAAQDFFSKHDEANESADRERERQERRALRRERRARRERQASPPVEQVEVESEHSYHAKPRGQQMYEDDIQRSINDFTHFRMDNQRESESIEKVELLSRMHQLEKEGYPPVKRMTVATPLDEIRYELYRMARESDRDKGLKSMRGYLVTGASLIEMFNSAVNPFDLRLDGFSTSVMMNAHEYDSTLAELHQKYSGRGSGMPPELRLAMSLCMAVITHHTSTAFTQATSRPNGAASMHNISGGAKGGGGLAGLFGGGGMNPMAMLASLFGNRATAAPAASSIPTARNAAPSGPRRGMSGPPDSD